MVRAPYPARIVAGLLVTALEETRKLPTLVVTLPMTAISETLQAGMRMQQNIAELAIKGDALFETLFDKPSDQPEWAVFDEDEIPGPDDEPAQLSVVTDRAPESEVAEDAADDESDDDPGSPAEADESDDTAPIAGAGRFALYSSAPATATVTETAPSGTATDSDDADLPDAVVELDYDALTLAQLRAKIRTLGLTDLEDLAAYERSHRGRAPFITMLDNRISAKTK